MLFHVCWYYPHSIYVYTVCIYSSTAQSFETLRCLRTVKKYWGTHNELFTALKGSTTKGGGYEGYSDAKSLMKYAAGCSSREWAWIGIRYCNLVDCLLVRDIVTISRKHDTTHGIHSLSDMPPHTKKKISQKCIRRNK